MPRMAVRLAATCVIVVWRGASKRTSLSEAVAACALGLGPHGGHHLAVNRSAIPFRYESNLSPGAPVAHLTPPSDLTRYRSTYLHSRFRPKPALVRPLRCRGR